MNMFVCVCIYTFVVGRAGIECKEGLILKPISFSLYYIVLHVLDVVELMGELDGSGEEAKERCFR